MESPGKVVKKVYILSQCIISDKSISSIPSFPSMVQFILNPLQLLLAANFIKYPEPFPTVYLSGKIGKHQPTRFNEMCK